MEDGRLRLQARALSLSDASSRALHRARRGRQGRGGVQDYREGLRQVLQRQRGVLDPCEYSPKLGSQLRADLRFRFRFPQWENIPKYSSAPYELTLKSNGCIILISTLSPSHILVTSKHSIGANAAASTDVSHSQRGEWWLEKHLDKVGKAKEDLAKELWDRGLTAVAEVGAEVPWRSASIAHI